MQILTSIIKTINGLSKESLDRLTKVVSLKEFSKGDIIVNTGDIPDTFFILKEGMIESLGLDEKGKNYIHDIVVPLSANTAFSSLILQKPSRFTHHCLTNCKIYVGNYQEFQKILDVHIHMPLLYGKILELVYLKINSREHHSSFTSEIEHHARLNNKIPTTKIPIPLSHFESCLNVSPIQLAGYKWKFAQYKWVNEKRSVSQQVVGRLGIPQK